LYVPEGLKGKAPAILNVIGHNQDAFRMELYQLINYNLVKKGIIVFAIDPPGQGEHVQYFDPAINFSSIGYSVIEHCYFGNQLFLSGVSPARYFIWDGIRAIDYLVSRNDVDPGRIGVTGWSGGGTVTSFISAFDERVKVSVPCSWATTNKRLLETKGIQDTENSFVHGLAKGITFEDLLEVRAPKPTLLAFNSRDEYLTIQGAYEAYAEAKKAYKTLVNEDNLQMVEDDTKHWMTPKIRSAIYGFFIKHFNIPGDASEQEVDLLSAADLTVTSTGQISTSLGGDMIFDVNKKEAAKSIERLAKSRKDIGKHLGEVVIKAKKVSGFIAPVSTAGNPLTNGTYQRKEYSVGKYAIAGEGEYAIPILLFVPNDSLTKHRALVYIHSGGKVTDAGTGGEIEKLVKMGYVVAAADILGIGETRNTVTNKEGTADAGNTAVLVGRSVVGIQAGDVIRVVDYLVRRRDVDATKVGVIGFNEMCIPVMHAAAFDHRINNVTLIGAPISYRSIIMNRFYRVGLTPTGITGPGLPYFIDFSSTIAGVLTAYDLPDLIGCIAPRKVVLAGLKDQMLEPASEALTNEELGFPRSAYDLRKASANMKVVTSYENLASLVDWCFIPN
jgi:cephalosporin-C deacetylase-like acetyl esterase